MIVIMVSFEWLRDWRIRRLARLTPMLDDYSHVSLDFEELKRVHRKRNVCKYTGHMWELESLIPSTSREAPYTYNVVCERCFPHIHSRRSIRSYNLFDVNEREQN